jgi:hypothetical protein
VKRLWWLLLTLLLAACGALAGPDPQSTLQAANAAFVQEKTGIAQTLDAREAMVSGTALAAETQVIERNSINQQLLATVRAGDPPTQQLVVANPTGNFPTALPNTDGVVQTPEVNIDSNAAPVPSGQFVEIVTASSVRESDGCAETPQSQFSTSDDRVYVVTRAAQVSAGTIIGVEWRFEGQPADSSSYTVSQDEQNFCLWFYLDNFSPGNWSVQLTADGAPITPAPSFTVIGA